MMTKEREVHIPILGTVTLRSITFGQLVDIEKEIRDLPQEDRSRRLANLVISAIVAEPDLSPDDIQTLEPEAMELLCEYAANYLGISEEFISLKGISSPQERLHAAHRRSWEKRIEKLNDSVTSALKETVAPLQSQLKAFTETAIDPSIAKMASESIVPFQDSLAKMAAFSQRISAPMLASEEIRKSIEPIRSAYENLGIDKSLQEMATEVAKLLPSEPLLSTALASSGLNHPQLHSPTFPLPSIRTIDLHRWVEEKEETEHSRRVDAFDALSSLEESLRDLISGAMHEEYGPKWWKRRVPPDVKDECRGRKRDKERPNRRSLHPIYYAHVGDYLKIIGRSDNWREVFKPIFGNRTELEATFKWVKRVRDPVAHSRPVDDTDYTMFYAGALWLRERIDQALSSLP